MKMIYDRLNTDELRGTTQADYLVSVDAHLRVVDGDLVIYDEPGFPVVELARSLLIWLGDADRSDFEFNSMSFEETGAITVRYVNQGWIFSSVFAPKRPSSSLNWASVEQCIHDFVARVERDLRELGVDPDGVTRR